MREAALTQFLAHGYDGASMDAIAAAAGTTKASLYTRFPGKEALFAAVLTWAIQRRDWPIPEASVPDPDDLEASLTAIAEFSLRRALDPAMVRLSQIAIAHASRFPEIARHAYAAGHWPRSRLVVDLLNRHAATGAITADEPETLAEHFLGLVSAVPARLASFGVVRDPVDLAYHTRSAVRLFLRSLRPEL